MSEKELYCKVFPSAEDDIRHAQPTGAEKQIQQTVSTAYRLAYDDMEFILRDEMRPVRLLLEHSKPELSFHHHNIDHTVVMFGSARAPNPDIALAELQQAQRNIAKSPDNEALQHQLMLAQSKQRKAAFYTQAQLLAKIITTDSDSDGVPKLHIVTGGGPGIMEAANRGASEAGGNSIGLNIVLPNEQLPNAYITPELCFQFHYFAMRKLHFLLRAKALIVFPGGYGTLDELFETLTLVQTQKIKPLPILIFGRQYWQRLINFDLLVEEGMISPEDIQWFQYVDTAEEAWLAIKQHLQNRAA